MTDEHNAGMMGCAGNGIVRTPNLDALAGRGVRFENCYCNSPLCVPSRLSFTSGKYASRVGAWNNNCWLPSPDYPSLPRLLVAKGYEAFLCGTGAQISPVVEIDRRQVGDGKVGDLTKKIQKLYFDAVKGNNPDYMGWLTPVY